MQNRRGFPNALRGFGISKHFSPLTMEPSQPLHGHSFPAATDFGTAAEPLMSEGILFFDILEFFHLPR